MDQYSNLPNPQQQPHLLKQIPQQEATLLYLHTQTQLMWLSATPNLERGSVNGIGNSPGCTENVLVKMPKCQLKYQDQHGDTGCGTDTKMDGGYQCVTMRPAASHQQVYGTHLMYDNSASHSVYGDLPPVYKTHVVHNNDIPSAVPDCCVMDDSSRGIEPIMLYNKSQHHQQPA